ncbi:MAG: vanillate O-demethylase oxygenase [Thermomicrobiales bacterium]|nr:vanillate O-demethylase oxygenase [Thermomicrobiales bacterium]
MRTPSGIARHARSPGPVHHPLRVVTAFATASYVWNSRKAPMGRKEENVFLKNAWYCAGWDYEVTCGKESLVTRKIANEHLVMFRTTTGKLVVLADRCPHRQAALSLGRKEGDTLRCMYHGMRFQADGTCVEVPGQSTIPERACVQTFPVVEKDNWIWVWMGDPAKADPNLICFSVGPGDPAWAIKTSKMRVNTNYRLEIANLADLSHLTWVHEQTVGGSIKYSSPKAQYTMTPRGLNTKFWVRNIPATAGFAHMFPPETMFDIGFDIEHTVPCNWIMHYTVHFAGTNTEGDSNGALVLDTWTCQTVTPRDADSVDYYYSMGPRKEQEFPGLSEMMRDTLDKAFREDAAVLEKQWERVKERPDAPQINIALDAGPGKMLWVLDKLLKQEAAEQRVAA